MKKLAALALVLASALTANAGTTHRITKKIICPDDACCANLPWTQVPNSNCTCVSPDPCPIVPGH